MKLLKSEQKALLTIKELTVDQGKINTIITNEQFEQPGLIGRNAITKATKSLHEKGLIFKVKNDDWFYRYTISEQGKAEVSKISNQNNTGQKKLSISSLLMFELRAKSAPCDHLESEL